MCQSVQKDEGRIYCTGRVDGKCPSGRIPYLEQANIEIWELFQAILPGVINGMGGYNYEAIRLVFESYNIGKEKWAEYTNKILLLLDVVRRLTKKDG